MTYARAFRLIQSRRMKLTEAQKKHLRGLGHQLKPVVLIGEAGLSESVKSEYLAAIEHHQLIKVSIRVGNRETRDSIIDALCRDAVAQLVTRVGNMALLFKPDVEKPKISLPSR